MSARLVGEVREPFPADPVLYRYVVWGRIAGLLALAFIFLFGALTARRFDEPAMQIAGLGVVIAELIVAIELLIFPPRVHWTRLSLFLLACDVLTITALVYFTGRSGSQYAYFFVLTILTAGLLHGQTVAVAFLALAGLGNAVVLIADLGGRSPPYTADVPTIRLAAALPLLAGGIWLLARYSSRVAFRAHYLQSLWESVSDGFFVLNRSAAVVDLNRQAAQLAGRTIDELRGAHLSALFAADEWARIREGLERFEGEEVVVWDTWMDGPGGGRVFVEVRARRIAGDRQGRILLLLHDVTHSRAMEQEIRHANVELLRINRELEESHRIAIEASRLKSQFLANMSHELRTPLNSVIGYTQYILDDPEHPVTADQRQDLGRVVHSARQLLALINELLDMARIESGRLHFSLSEVPLGPLIDQTVSSVIPMVAEKSLDCRLDLAPDLGSIETDAERFRQVLLNLLSNAIKFTERGGIAVFAARHDGHVEIAVADTGIGIPAEEQRLIFTEFRQSNPDIHRRYGGSGLGLAIARRLIERMGGKIEVASEVGRGSRFTVRLPVRQEADFEGPEQSP